MTLDKRETTRNILRSLPANLGSVIEAADKFKSGNSYLSWEVVYQEIINKKKLSKPLPTRSMTTQENNKFNKLCDDLDANLDIHPHSKVTQKQIDDVIWSLTYSNRLKNTKG